MLENQLTLPSYIRRQYLFVDFHWSQYSLYYVTVGDPFSQFQFFQSLFTERGDLSLKKSAFHIWLVGKRSAFGQKSGGHLVGICLILVKKSFGNTARGNHWNTQGDFSFDPQLLSQSFGWSFHESHRNSPFFLSTSWRQKPGPGKEGWILISCILGSEANPSIPFLPQEDQSKQLSPVSWFLPSLLLLFHNSVHFTQ